MIFQNQNLSTPLSDSLNEIIYLVKESVNESATFGQVEGLLEPEINLNFEYTGRIKLKINSGILQICLTNMFYNLVSGTYYQENGDGTSQSTQLNSCNSYSGENLNLTANCVIQNIFTSGKRKE